MIMILQEVKGAYAKAQIKSKEKNARKAVLTAAQAEILLPEQAGSVGTC